MSRANRIIEELETTVQQEIDPEAMKANFSSVLPQGWQVEEVKMNELGEVMVVFKNEGSQESIETVWVVGKNSIPMVSVSGTDLAVDLSNFNPPMKETAVGPIIDFSAGLGWVTPTLSQVLVSSAVMKTSEEPEEEPEGEEQPQNIQTPTQGMGSPEQESKISEKQFAMICPTCGNRQWVHSDKDKPTVPCTGCGGKMEVDVSPDAWDIRSGKFLPEPGREESKIKEQEKEVECPHCGKVFAGQEIPDNNKCPKCGEELVDITGEEIHTWYVVKGQMKS